MLLDSDRNRSIIDCMRAFGIVLVIVFHVVVGIAAVIGPNALPQYIDAMPGALNVAWQALGSELVFLFSGFLLSYLLLRELKQHGRIDLRNFYLKRVARILPMYFLALTLYAFFAKFTIIEFVLNVLFVSKLFGAETIVPVGWSLEVLVQSFLLLPLITLAFVRSKIPLTLTIAAMIACLAARYHVLVSDPASYQLRIYEILAGVDTTATLDDLYYHLGYRATPFLLGFLTAYLVLHKERLLQRAFANRLLAPVLLLLSLALIIGSGFLPIHDETSVLYSETGDAFWLWFWTIQRFVFAVGMCLFALCIWYYKTRLLVPIVSFMRLRAWRYVSENIYSIFLFHPILLIPAAVIGFRTADPERMPPVHIFEVLLVMGLALLFSTLFGQLVTRYVETPSRTWIRGRFAR